MTPSDSLCECVWDFVLFNQPQQGQREGASERAKRSHTKMDNKFNKS